jgi:tRNA-specific 2-thiouridylase
MTKADVRQKGREMGLSVADKPESREICFVPDGNYGRFVSEFAGASEAGPIVGPDGKEAGEHQGVFRYTIGQRHGLGISFGQPVYVKKIDPARKAVYLAYDSELWRRAFVVREVNWVSVAPPKKEVRATVRIRYLAKEKPASIIPLGEGKAEVIFDAPERAITPGQSAVFYDGNLVLGGGIIEQAIED